MGATSGQLGSISRWIARLKARDPEAAQRLWQRYASRVLRLASRKLRPWRGAFSDEEDVTIDVFAALCRGAARGDFPSLENRKDLWGLLVSITERRVIDARRRAGREKRRGERPWTDLLSEPNATSDGSGWREELDRRPGPAETALLADECRRLMDCLQDDVLRAIAALRLQGYTIEEVAQQLGRPLRTVERKLALIRKLWRRAGGEEEAV